MSNVTTLPRQPRATHPRPLTFRGAYGHPGGDGLDRFARLLVEFGLEELAKGNLDQQPPANPGALSTDTTEEPVT